MKDNNSTTETELLKASRKISYIIGEETFPKIENLEEVSESYFTEVYQRAFSLIETIIETFNKSTKDKRKERERNRYPHQQEDFNNYHNDEDNFLQQNEKQNNIIAFIGERGSGKTSCMLTVRSILHQLNMVTDEKKISEIRWLNNKEKIRSTYFQTLEIIDPSYFESENNILEIIISKMFKEFKRYAQNPQRRLDCEDAQYVEKKRKLIRHFQEVKDSLDEIKQKRDKSNDSIEELSKMASSMELKEQIQNLISCYLDYFGSKEDVLLIAVDDIDLQTDHAGLMIEQIRKYLITPNVIILMALKLNQLTDIIKQDYYRSYKILIEHEKNLSDSIADMTERYLTKFLPYEHRLYLPELQLNMDIPLEIIEKYRNNTPKSSSKTETDAVGGALHNTLIPINQYVLKLLREKVKQFFYNKNNHSSLIIPTNLRGLLNLVSMLYKMQNKISGKEAQYNEYLFKHYLLENWCRENVRKELQELLNALQDESPAIINKRIMTYLIQLDETVFKEKDKNNEVRPEFREDNKYYNISLADVLGALQRLEDCNASVQIQKEIFAIKTCYSILLQENFQFILTEQYSIQRAFSSYLGNLYKPSSIENPILYGNRFSNYTRILNGDIIPSYNKNFCIGNRTTYPKKIKGNILNNLFNSIILNIENPVNTIFQFTHENENFQLTIKDAVNIWEFFILHISFGSYIYADNYRTKSICYYDYLPYNLGVQCIFDISSIFFNVAKYYQYYVYIMQSENKSSLNKGLKDLRKMITNMMHHSLLKKIYEKDDSNKPIISNNEIFNTPEKNNDFNAISEGNNEKTIVSSDKPMQENQQFTSSNLFPHICNIEILENLIDYLTFYYDEDEETEKRIFNKYITPNNEYSNELKESLKYLRIFQIFYEKIDKYKIPYYNHEGKEIPSTTITLKKFKILKDYISDLLSEKEGINPAQKESVRLFSYIYNSMNQE